jgi:hypothetical protein
MSVKQIQRHMMTILINLCETNISVTRYSALKEFDIVCIPSSGDAMFHEMSAL